MRARAASVALGAAFVASCAAIVGLEDHQLAPAGADASSVAVDAGPCGPCPAPYACLGGQCSRAVVEVAASATHSCAVLLGGEVWCWGKSQLGALGVDAASTPGRCGALACRATPARIEGIANAAHVALGVDVTCVLGKDGKARCLGRSDRGALGHDPSGDPRCAEQTMTDGGAPTMLACTSSPAPVTLAGSPTIAQLSAGDAVCARTSDGDAFCWGDDYLAGAGVYPIPNGGVVSTPTKIAGISRATAMVMSGTYSHGCIVGFFDGVSCWGSNLAGELGHDAGAGDQGCIFGVPCSAGGVGVKGAAGTTLTAGQKVSCVRQADGKVMCWGANDSAQLANGASVDSSAHPTPALVAGLTNIVAIEARFETGFAIDGSGDVWAWGLASDGALGVAAQGLACASGTCAPKPVQVPALAGATQIASTRAGGIALKGDGSVWVWGINDLAQLGHAPGDGDEACKDGPCRTTPAPLVGLP